MNLGSFLSMSLIWLLLGQSGFDWVSFNMVKRTSVKGKATRMDARIYFKSNGDMVTYLSDPSELFILNNAKGELQVFNPAENSVFKTINYDFGSQNNPFYYFLGEIPNMGLDQVGYTIGETKIDGSYLVTSWLPPKRLDADIKKVELVSDGDKIVFMGFIDEENEYFKKMYFYDFSDLRGLMFPTTITEVDFVEEDSIITKTEFKDFAFDSYQDKELLNFKIPEGAKLVK